MGVHAKAKAAAVVQRTDQHRRGAANREWVPFRNEAPKSLELQLPALHHALCRIALDPGQAVLRGAGARSHTPGCLPGAATGALGAGRAAAEGARL